MILVEPVPLVDLPDAHTQNGAHLVSYPPSGRISNNHPHNYIIYIIIMKGVIWGWPWGGVMKWIACQFFSTAPFLLFLSVLENIEHACCYKKSLSKKYWKTKKLEPIKEKSVTVFSKKEGISKIYNGVSIRGRSRPKDHWIKSDQASGEPTRAGPGLDFAERRVRGCSVGCSRPRDLKIGTHGYMVMVIEIFRKFSDPGHFKYLPALWFRDFIVNYCKLL